MRTQHLLVLVVAAVIAVAAALWTGSLHEPEHAPGAGSLLVPGLEPRLNDVSAVRIRGQKDLSVTLERGANTWTVPEKSGYPADTGKVRKLLIGIAQSKLIEQKTSNPEHYAELGVADPGAPSDAAPEADASKAAAKPASSALVEIDAPIGDKNKAEIIVGGNARGATGTYVRKAGEAQTWLASGDLAVEADPLKWVNPQIMNVPATRIQSVSIHHPDGQTLIIDKATREAPNYVVHDVPDKREVKFASVGNPLASVLATLKLDDIATPADRDPAAHSPLVVEYRTFDGLVVTAQSYVDGDKHYVRFAAAFDEAQAQRFYVAPAPAALPANGAATPEAEADGTAKSGDQAPASASGATASPAATPPAEGSAAPSAPAAPDFSAVRAEAETLNKDVQPWVFVIGSYKYDQMNKHVADMLKDVEPPADAKKTGNKKTEARKPTAPQSPEEEPIEDEL